MTDPHATGSRAANPANPANPAKMDEFRAGYDFGYGDGQVGEYQPEKHRASRAAVDREDLLTRYTTELFLQHNAQLTGLRDLLRRMISEIEGDHAC